MSQNLPTKLNIKFSDKVLIINDKSELYQKLYHYNIILYEKYKDLELPNVIIIFVEDMSKLDIYMSEYHTNIYNHAHILWLCYPKQTSKLASDINRDKMRKRMIEKYNLTWVRLVSLDDDYSAFRFTRVS